MEILENFTNASRHDFVLSYKYDDANKTIIFRLQAWASVQSEEWSVGLRKLSETLRKLFEGVQTLPKGVRRCSK